MGAAGDMAGQQRSRGSTPQGNDDDFAVVVDPAYGSVDDVEKRKAAMQDVHGHVSQSWIEATKRRTVSAPRSSVRYPLVC